MTDPSDRSRPARQKGDADDISWERKLVEQLRHTLDDGAKILEQLLPKLGR